MIQSLRFHHLGQSGLDLSLYSINQLVPEVFGEPQILGQSCQWFCPRLRALANVYRDLSESGYRFSVRMLPLDSQRKAPMTKPIPDEAEIALEYPDKLYVGTFEPSSRFEAHLDPTGIALILERPGADDVRKSIHMHINFGLFADIVRELAATVGRIPRKDVMHRDQLAQAAAELHKALADNPAENQNEDRQLLRRLAGAGGA